MSVYQVAAFAVVASVLVTMLKREKAEFALPVQVGAIVVILLSVVHTAAEIFRSLTDFASTGGLDQSYVRLLLRALCMSAVGEWSAAFCKDAGLSAMAMVVEFVCGVLLLSMCMPLMQTVLQFAKGFFI